MRNVVLGVSILAGIIAVVYGILVFRFAGSAIHEIEAILAIGFGVLVITVSSGILFLLDLLEQYYVEARTIRISTEALANVERGRDRAARNARLSSDLVAEPV